MSSVARNPSEYQARLRDYILERSEESRAIRVGEKEISEQAGIVARYSDLFTAEQLEALRGAHAAAASDEDRELVYRLQKACESGVIASQLAPVQDELQNAELALRVEHGDESVPLRTASARLGTIADYAERAELGEATWAASAQLNEQRLRVTRAGEELRAELSGVSNPIARSEEDKQVSLRELEQALVPAAERASETYDRLRERWLDTILGSERDNHPAAYHAAYVNRLYSLADVYTKERATEVCLATLRELGFSLADSNIKTDLEDRPQKSPRPVVIAPDPPAIVHLITRAQGGVQDYQDFLHEAGHALHFAGSEPSLPYAFRVLSRDYALTEIFSYVVQSIVREPGWHALYFDLAPEHAAANAEAVRFLDMFMFRRYLAKLQFELEFWGRFAEDGGTADGYAERLTRLTGFTYRPDRFIADMDAGFYSADYLRAWIRAAQLRAHLRREVGDDWWQRHETGDILRELFREGLRPSSEEIAARLGFEPLDVEPLVAEHVTELASAR